MPDELRDLLETAYTESEEGPQEQNNGESIPQEEAADPQSVPEEQAPHQEEGEVSGEPTEAEGAVKDQGEVKKEGGEAKKEALADTPTTPTPSSDGLKPPLGWDLQAKEQWKGLTPELRKAIHAREVEVARTIHGTAEARKTQKFLGELTGSYATVMAAEGYNSPVEAIQGIMQTVSQLRMGSPSQKATTLAQLVDHYGVDIGLLDGALAGGAPAEQGGQPQSPDNYGIQKMLDERLAPINQLLEQVGSATNHNAEKARQDSVLAVQQFSQDAEFINEVRHDMADIIDMATKRGQQLTIKQAYDKACYLHPEVSRVMDTRQKAQTLASAGSTVASKRNAASSIKGTPSGAGVGAGAQKDLRTTISSLWDEFDGTG